MTAADHIPTMHANVDGPNGKGSSWVVCSCGITGIPRDSLKKAWDAFYDHLELYEGREIARKAVARRTSAPNQTERLFVP